MYLRYSHKLFLKIIIAADLFLLALYDPQEEEGPGRQNDSVRLRAGRRGRDHLTVFVPLDFRFRHAFGFAVQRQRLVLRHGH